MFNKVVMLGNLTRDPEIRYLPNGSAVTTIGLAVNRKFKKQDGSQGEEVCFIDVTFFGRTAEIANQYLNRGKKVLVEGRLKLDQWTDNQGMKRSKHSITAETLQMLDGQRGEASAPITEEPTTYAGDAPVYDHRPRQPRVLGDIHEMNINDEEILF